MSLTLRKLHILFQSLLAMLIPYVILNLGLLGLDYTLLYLLLTTVVHQMQF
uniref:Uncharacterized protein n=1 Tax=Arundo donax TaxID=35708 RepID=A0A0A9FQN8_ARUDO